MSRLFDRFGPVLGGAFLGLVVIWLVAMVLAPNVTMIDFSLRPNLDTSDNRDFWGFGRSGGCW